MSIPAIVIIMVVIFLGFIILMTMSFSPKSMGKKVNKNMEHMGGMMGNMVKEMINVEKQILEENEEDLRSINTKGAEIESDALQIKARAIKKGLIGDEEIGVFCKHCGQKIESDSKFCRYCGKEQ